MDIPWQFVRLGGTVVLTGVPVAYYIYNDTQKRGNPHPLRWAIGVGIFGIFGLFIYVAIKERSVRSAN